MLSLLSPSLVSTSTPLNLLFPRDCVQYVMQFTDIKSTLSMFLVCPCWYHAVDRFVLLEDTYYYLPELYRDIIIQMIRRRPMPTCGSSSVSTLLRDDVRWGYVDLMVLKVQDTLQPCECFPASLKSLYLRESESDSITDTDVCLLGFTTLTSLTSLDLEDCQLITDAGLAHVSTLTSLTSLNIEDCMQITDAGLAHVSKLTSLTSLNLSLCKLVTDAGLAHVSTLTSLTSLILRKNQLITDAGLAHLSRLTSLTSFNLSFCKLVTDAGLAHVSRLTSLKVLIPR